MGTSPTPSLRSDGRTVHVIGGGLGGLAAAVFVARAGRRVVVHEQRGRLGGRATTDERHGYRFNQGPHALYVGAEAAEVLTELGIHPGGPPPPTRGVLMVSGGESHLAPGGPFSLAATRLLGVRDKVDLARLLGRLDRIDASTLGSTTIGEWIASRTDREAVAAVLHAVVRLATYANTPEVFSADVAVRQVQLALSSGVIYLDGGWETLVSWLADAVTAAGGEIETSDGPTAVPDAPAVIVATGSPSSAASLLGESFSHGPVTEASVLDLALTEPSLRRTVIGVDEPIYLSDHGSPASMTPRGAGSLSIAQYLAPDGAPGDEPDRQAMRDFAHHAGIGVDDVVEERYLHRMTTVSAIASADLGGLAGRPGVAVADRPGTYVVGDWVGAHGHLADAVLHSAREAARLAVAHLDRTCVV